MGYTTDFTGSIKVEPPLNEAEIAYINKFNQTRRIHRKKGPYFIDGSGDSGQGHDGDVIDYNTPDPTQPGLWCQWEVSEDGARIEWDGGEKFYHATEWMKYIVDHFIGNNPIAKKELSFLQGHTVNGEIFATGEEAGDNWKIKVVDGIVTEKRGTITYDA